MCIRDSTKTVVAISKFQAEHDLEVTGEVSPQLAGILKAEIKNQGQPATAESTAQAAPAQAPPQRTEEELRAAQQACLQERYEAQQASAKKKRGFGSLMRAVSRTASQFGGSEISRAISQTSADVYSANATVADVQSAAKDLGLTEEDIEACRNP